MNTTDKQTDLIDEAYENFGDRVDEMWQKSGVGDLDDFLYDGLLVDGYDDKGKWFARLPTKEEFVNKCKTDEVFSKRWDITIETRELSLEERNYTLGPGKAYRGIFGMDEKDDLEYKELFDKENRPTKLTTITYNGQVEEKYE